MQRIVIWRSLKMTFENVDMELEKHLSKVFDKVIFSKTHWKHASDVCHECRGEGKVELSVFKPHGFNRDVGYEESIKVPCETCDGEGRIVIEIDF